MDFTGNNQKGHNYNNLCGRRFSPSINSIISHRPKSKYSDVMMYSRQKGKSVRKMELSIGALSVSASKI